MGGTGAEDFDDDGREPLDIYDIDLRLLLWAVFGVLILLGFAGPLMRYFAFLQCVIPQLN